MSHKANYDPGKFISEGKGVNIADRTHYEKV